MPKFEYRVQGRDWQSVLHETPTLAAFDDLPDRIKGGAAEAVSGAFRALDIETDNRANQPYVVKGDMDGDSFSLTVGPPVKKAASKAKRKAGAKK